MDKELPKESNDEYSLEAEYEGLMDPQEYLRELIQNSQDDDLAALEEMLLKKGSSPNLALMASFEERRIDPSLLKEIAQSLLHLTDDLNKVKSFKIIAQSKIFPLAGILLQFEPSGNSDHLRGLTVFANDYELKSKDFESSSFENMLKFSKDLNSIAIYLKDIVGRSVLNRREIKKSDELSMLDALCARFRKNEEKPTIQEQLSGAIDSNNYEFIQKVLIDKECDDYKELRKTLLEKGLEPQLEKSIVKSFNKMTKDDLAIEIFSMILRSKLESETVSQSLFPIPEILWDNFSSSKLQKLSAEFSSLARDPLASPSKRKLASFVSYLSDICDTMDLETTKLDKDLLPHILNIVKSAAYKNFLDPIEGSKIEVNQELFLNALTVMVDEAAYDGGFINIFLKHLMLNEEFLKNLNELKKPQLALLINSCAEIRKKVGADNENYKTINEFNLLINSILVRKEADVLVTKYDDEVVPRRQYYFGGEASAGAGSRAAVTSPDPRGTSTSRGTLTFGEFFSGNPDHDRGLKRLARSTMPSSAASLGQLSESFGAAKLASSPASAHTMPKAARFSLTEPDDEDRSGDKEPSRKTSPSSSDPLKQGQKDGAKL